jgi:purine/pyrimidine-nucleoside phosphorylase
MSDFSGVTVVREANIYFNGAVASHTVLFPDGSKKLWG